MPSLPDRYPFAEAVPRGGSCCANCHYLRKDGKSCANKFYVRENDGSHKLGDKADRFCCMAWSAEARRKSV